jgi:transposase
MIEGGLSKNLSAKRAAMELRRIRPADAIGAERKHLAVELLDEVRRHDRSLIELHQRIITAVRAANTTVTDVRGVGPIVAAYLIGYSGDVRRFPTAGHYARYNATAPIEASSGPTIRHRLNPNGNRQLNHAIHIAARTDLPRHARPRLLPRQTNRREVAQRSHALPQTTDQRRRLPTTPRRQRPLNENGVREDNQGRL